MLCNERYLVKLPFPAFVDAEAEREKIERPVFVARERELERLNGFLERALAGQGKTALMGEFVRRAMHVHPDLLVATGACNALSGVGDPHLPLRGVMGMLTGDVETRWAAGVIILTVATVKGERFPARVQKQPEREVLGVLSHDFFEASAVFSFTALAPILKFRAETGIDKPPENSYNRWCQGLLSCPKAAKPSTTRRIGTTLYCGRPRRTETDVRKFL